MERCGEWAEQLIDQTKSFPAIQKATGSPKPILFGVVLLFFISWLVVRAVLFLKKPVLSRPATPDLEKPAARNFKAPPRPLGGLLHPRQR